MYINISVVILKCVNVDRQFNKIKTPSKFPFRQRAMGSSASSTDLSSRPLVWHAWHASAMLSNDQHSHSSQCELNMFYFFYDDGWFRFDDSGDLKITIEHDGAWVCTLLIILAFIRFYFDSISIQPHKSFDREISHTPVTMNLLTIYFAVEDYQFQRRAEVALISILQP